MNHNDMLRMLRHMAVQSMMQREHERYFGEIPVDLHRLEHDPNIKTAITDRDMLMLHIDMALDAGDEDAFMRLAEELKGMEVSA